MRKSGFYKNCEICGKPYWAYRYNAHKRKYCSIKCHSKVKGAQISQTKRQISRQNLISGKEFKGRFWSYLYLEWRYACLKRDKYTCQKCGKVMKPRFLIVHHIKSWEEAPELRVEVSNGITLCRGCHNSIHILPNRKKNHGF